MLIIDAHLDIGWNALQWNRDLQLSTYTIRTQEVNMHGPGRAQGTTSLPALREGRIALCFSTLLARSTGQTVPHEDYSSPAQAFAIARGQLAYYRALEKLQLVHIITDSDALREHMAQWEVYDNQSRASSKESDHSLAPPAGFIVSMESADPILRPEELHEWWEAGVRIIGPAHYGPGRYAGGTGTELGLTEMGRELVTEMRRLHILLDVTHLSDQAFWQALELYDGILIASHNNCRALVPHQRQLSDEQLHAIIARDGAIGVACDTWMLQSNWKPGTPSGTDVGLSRVVEQIDHICQLAGNSRHAAIGSDLDGGFGREQSPCDLDTIADLQRIGELLRARGYGEGDVAAILHGNWLRVLYQIWDKTDQNTTPQPAQKAV